MAVITVRVLGDDINPLWLFQTHTAHSAVEVQHRRVKYCIPMIMANVQCKLLQAFRYLDLKNGVTVLCVPLNQA
jgi:hypothetical protein